MTSEKITVIEREALAGNIKVTRDDWLRVAMDILISDGVDSVKVLVIGERLNVFSEFIQYTNAIRGEARHE